MDDGAGQHWDLEGRGREEGKERKGAMRPPHVVEGSKQGRLKDDPA